MLRSIEDGRPFLFAWRGHVYVAYGLTYSDGVNPFGVHVLQVWTIELIDPLFKYGAPKFTSFAVMRDDPSQVNGTLELKVTIQR